jgi:hypothetical protein
MLSEILRKKIKLSSNTELQANSRRTPESFDASPAKTAGN